MSQVKPEIKRVYGSIAVAFGWLLFLAFWLFYYASNYGIIQNIGVLLASIVVAGYYSCCNVGSMGNETGELIFLIQ